MVEIEIISTETIKPSSPTPDGLKRFSLSVFDQFLPDIYTSVVLFYPAGSQSSYSDRIRRLKLSLSEALVRFYPVAGRLVRAENYVDCIDAGVDFLEAKVKGCRLSDILGCPDDKVVRKLIPVRSGAQPLMRVQANALECGGMAIGATFSHVIMDASAMSAFLKGWTTAAARGNKEPPAQELNVFASRFPPIPIDMPPVGPGELYESNRRRFVFQAAKIAALRDKSSSAGGGVPTRLAAVSALIWKCIINTLTKKLVHETRPCIVSQPMNLRARLEPPLSESSLGNMTVPIFAESGDHRELQELASKLRQGLRDTTCRYVTKSGDSEATRTMCFEDAIKVITLSARNDINFFALTSWCRFGWYELDFGWDRPAWISPFIFNPHLNNLVLMTDTRDADGIEVFVSLPEEDMISFETDPELLEFCTLNPSASLKSEDADNN